MKSSVITLPPVIVIVIVRHRIPQSQMTQCHCHGLDHGHGETTINLARREIKRINNWFGTVPKSFKSIDFKLFDCTMATLHKLYMLA